jgi:CheY-like chemotaxis protein
MELRLAPDLRPAVADRGQLEQVFVNLVVNARDAMPNGGSLTVETANVRLDAEYVSSHVGVAPGDYAMLAVSDTGSGMTDDVKTHLFEPFFTTKEIGKGTGLGLATCYAIVRQLGGHIGVYSELDVGTTMRVYVPNVAGQTVTEEHGARAIPRGGHEAILLVEDEPQVRRVAHRALSALGYTVYDAADAEAAIALLADLNGPVDLLFTDVVLPKMNGSALADHAATLRPGIHVLFASGYSDNMVLQHRLLDKEVMLVHKPYTSDSLAAKVREALDRK